MDRRWGHRSLADWLTLSRLGVAPLLLFAGALKSTPTFVLLCLWGALSDVFDGVIARATRRETEAGARLDSRADLCFYSAWIIGFGFLMPQQMREQAHLAVIVAVSYTTPIVVGWFKFGRLTSYHTVLARLSLVLMVAGLLCWQAFGELRPLRLAVAVVVISSAEELLLTLLLPTPLDNVPHLFAALAHSQGTLAQWKRPLRFIRRRHPRGLRR